MKKMFLLIHLINYIIRNAFKAPNIGSITLCQGKCMLKSNINQLYNIGTTLKADSFKQLVTKLRYLS